MKWQDKFEKDGMWYRGEAKEWERKKYGFYPCGSGDLIYNNCRIIYEGYTKGWALVAHVQMERLLTYRKRWPDDMNNDQVARNRIEWRFSQLMCKLGRRETELYRPQGHMTQDPFIAFHAAGVAMGFPVKSFYVRPPWYLMKPEFRAWLRAIRGKRNLYKFWRWVNASSRKHEFVTVLDDMMRSTYDKLYPEYYTMTKGPW